MNTTLISIHHRPTDTLLVEGPLGWGITPFEGNFYVRSRYVRHDGFRTTLLPGLCPYKFVYLWVDLELPNGSRQPMLGWRYVLPNPLLPFVAFRLALPGSHADLVVNP